MVALSGTVSDTSGGSSALPSGFTPVLVVPNFDVNDMGDGQIKQAIISMSDGYQAGDKLDIDANYSVVKVGDKYMVDQTNIEIMNGGFGDDSHQLVLSGMDNAETYANIMESILLENVDGVLGTQHMVNFSILGDDDIEVDLGTTLVITPKGLVTNKTLLDEISDNDMLNTWVDDKGDAISNNYFDELSFENIFNDDRNLEFNRFPSTVDERNYIDQDIYQDWLVTMQITPEEDDDNWVNLNYQKNANDFFLSEASTEINYPDGDEIFLGGSDNYSF